MRTFTFRFFALLFLSSHALAQAQIPIQKPVAPQFAGTYKVSEGKLTSASNTRANFVSIYNNNTLTNYYSVPGIDQEWVDEGQFCGQSERQITCFDFVYCSTEPDPSQNSGTITFTFYDEFTICAGPSNGGNFANGGFVCAYDVVGLPLGDPNGVIQCWIVSVDLSGGFECTSDLTVGLTADEANGKLFGWGIIPRNNNTGPWLASGGKGADNAFVWFDSFGIFQGCFWFGGVPFASFSMQLYGWRDGWKCYLSPTPSPCSVEVDGTENSPDVWTISILNPNGAYDYYAVVSTSPADITLPSMPCQVLVNPAGILVPPVQIPTPGSLTVDISPGSGLTLYFQAFAVAAGSGPPSASNLPLGASIGCKKCF